MKLVTLILTFILSAQLVYANATVCSNYGKCSQMSSSKKSQMRDCPFHSNQSQENKDKSLAKTNCKCCAVMMLETLINKKPTLDSVLNFIEFEFLEKSQTVSSTLFLRPPIS